MALSSVDRCTLEAIGSEVGVTRERVRQIESRTLSKLKNSREAQKLKGEEGTKEPRSQLRGWGLRTHNLPVNSRTLLPIEATPGMSATTWSEGICPFVWKRADPCLDLGVTVGAE